MMNFQKTTAGYKPAVLIFLLSLLSLADQAMAFRLNFSASKSNQTFSNQVLVSSQFSETYSGALSYSSSKDLTQTISDPDSNIFKMSLTNGVTNQYSLSMGLRTIDDMYDFKGNGLDLRYSKPIVKRAAENDIDLATTIFGKFDLSRRTYTPNSAEAYTSLKTTAGLEFDWTSQLSLNADMTVDAYSFSGSQMQSSSSGKVISDQNLSATVANLSFISTSIGADFYWDQNSIGWSLSQSIPKRTDQTHSSSIDIYFGTLLFDRLSLDLSWSRGRSEGSLDTSNTIGIGFGFNLDEVLQK